MPREPHRICGRAERPGCLVQIAQEAAERGRTVQAPRPGLGELAVDERQYLAARLVQTRANQARCTWEADVLEVAQERMDRMCPRPDIADHHVAQAVDDGPATASQHDQIIGRGHGPLSVLAYPYADQFSGARGRGPAAAGGTCGNMQHELPLAAMPLPGIVAVNLLLCADLSLPCRWRPSAMRRGRFSPRSGSPGSSGVGADGNPAGQPRISPSLRGLAV